MAIDLYTVRFVLGRYIKDTGGFYDKIPSSIGGSLTIQYGDKEKTFSKNNVDYEDWKGKVITWGEAAYINIPAGAEITLIASPNAGYFVHGFYYLSSWDITTACEYTNLDSYVSSTIDETGATSVSVVPSNNRTILVVFDWYIKDSPIYIESDPPQAGTAVMKDGTSTIMIQYPADDTYDSSINMGSAYIGGTPQTVTLEASPNSGFTFSHWERRENIMARFGLENIEASYQDDPSFDIVSWEANERKTTKFAWIDTTEAIVPEAHLPDQANYYYGDHASFFIFVAVFNDDSVAIDTTPDYTRELENPVKLSVAIRGSGKVSGIDRFGFSYDDKTSNTSMRFEHGEYITLFAEANSGYVFSRFEGAVNGASSPAFILMDEDKWVTVVFEEAPVLAVSITGSGTVVATDGDINCPGICTDTYPEKDAIDTLTATPGAGYYFKEWTGDIESINEEIVVTMSDDVTVTAVFEPNPATTITIEGSGTVTASRYDSGSGTWISYLTVSAGTNGATVPINSNVKLEASGAFVKWKGDVSGYLNPFYPVFVNGDKTITAVFGTQYTVSINTTPSGIGYVLGEDIDIRGGVTSFKVLSGETLHLFAVTDKKGIYRFSGWSGSLSGSTNPISTTISGNISVTAEFEIIQYRITLAGDGAVEMTDGVSTINYPGSAYADFDVETEITLTATPPDGKSFWHWGGDIEGADNPITVRVTADMRIHAAFYGEGELGWLVKRTPRYIISSQRWSEFVTAIEKFWMERFDPFLKYLTAHRSIFSASLEARGRIVKELGKYFEASLPPEKLPVAIQRRKINLFQKGEIAPILEMLGKIDPSATVEWVPFYAPKALPYGTIYYTEGELADEGLASDDVFLTSKGRLALNGFRLPFMSRDDWSALFRTLKPLHIGFDTYPGFEDGSADIGSGFDGCSVDIPELIEETLAVEIVEHVENRENFININDESSVRLFFIDNYFDSRALYTYIRVKYNPDHFTFGSAGIGDGILSVDPKWSLSTSIPKAGEILITISYDGAVPTHVDFALNQLWTYYGYPFNCNDYPYAGWNGSITDDLNKPRVHTSSFTNGYARMTSSGVIFFINFNKRSDISEKKAFSEINLLDYGYFYEGWWGGQIGFWGGSDYYGYLGLAHIFSQKTGKDYIDKDISDIQVNVLEDKNVAGKYVNILSDLEPKSSSLLKDAPDNFSTPLPMLYDIVKYMKWAKIVSDSGRYISEFMIDNEYPYWPYFNLHRFGLFPAPEQFSYPMEVKKTDGLYNYSLTSDDGVNFKIKKKYGNSGSQIVVADLNFENGNYGRQQAPYKAILEIKKDVPSYMANFFTQEPFDNHIEKGSAISSMFFLIDNIGTLDETLTSPQIPYDEFTEDGTKLLFFNVPETSTVTLNLKQNYSGMSLYVKWDGAFPSALNYDAKQIASTDAAMTQAGLPAGTYYALLVLKDKNEGFAYNGWRIELTFS